ncbi:MAG: bifunctional isocitrate dehydrogenase kinase/phosphatase [Acidobacteriota bacterium]
MKPDSARPSRDAVADGADTILRGFEDYHQRFLAITRRATQRFAQRDWRGIRRDTVERTKLQPQMVAYTLELLRDQLGDTLEQLPVWTALKAAFTAAVLGRDDFELAQTFFNSLTRRLHPHVGLDPSIDFEPADFPLPYQGWEMASARTYAVRRVGATVVRRLLLDADLRAPFADLDGTAVEAAATIQRAVDDELGGKVEALDLLRPVFVRNKGAYLVGRLRRGDEHRPLVLALVHGERGLSVDAVLLTENEVSIVFSFARWYFHAAVETPRAVIGFLKSLMPKKRTGELYISLGYFKHGKTELYGDILKQSARDDRRFVVAPGERGLVMAVFTVEGGSPLGSSGGGEFVFKIIKDRFPAQKRTSRAEIKKRYKLVLHHDRVGRLVDYQEFEDLVFPKARFAPELLDELLDVAGKTVEAQGDDVIVRHLYVGRRVYPLDLFLRHESDEKAKAAVVDWGRALRELAAANLFAGDMLTKNFGVTRHGRVVFYDYDELLPLTECTFRQLPPPRDEVEALLDQPHFSTAEGDVFPEEMRRFLGLKRALREVFERAHQELFGVYFWRQMQDRQQRGEMLDVFPYRRQPPLSSGP